MLNIEVLEKKEDHLILKLTIPKRATINQPVYILRVDDIVQKIDEEIKKDKSIDSYEFLTNIETMKNKLSTGITEQIVEIKLMKKKRKTPAKSRKKKSHKDKSSGSSS